VGKGLQRFLPATWILSAEAAVEGPMTRKDKIAFIKSSKRKTHVYNDLTRYTEQQLNDVIREIVHGLVRESEIIANAYINGYR
jgi:predicted nucleic acid-binding OB-fold protein